MRLRFGNSSNKKARGRSDIGYSFNKKWNFVSGEVPVFKRKLRVSSKVHQGIRLL